MRGPASRSVYRSNEVQTSPGVAGNARLTGGVAAALLVLLAAEGATVPFIGQLLGPHVFIGMLLIPPVLLKLGSTGYRFARYYSSNPAYVRRGPPNIALRVLSSVILRALARSGRLVRLRLEIMDRPGVLASVATIIGNAGGNIIDVSHHRDLPGVPLKDAVLEVSLETRDRAHAEAIVALLRERKFVVTVA